FTARDAKPGSKVASKEEQPQAGAGVAGALDTLFAGAAGGRGAPGATQSQARHKLQEGPGPKGGPGLSKVVGGTDAPRFGLQLFLGLEIKERHLGFQRAERVASQAERLCAGHGNDLCRSVER